MDSGRNKIIGMLLLLLLYVPATQAQLPGCSLTAPIYYLGTGGLGSGIYNVDPGQPLVPGINPCPNTIIQVPGEGLAAGRNLNSSSPATTFYTVQAGKYLYYDGNAWINTGHNAGSVNAINPACSGNYIFNFDILTGKIWRYDGNSDAIDITTVSSAGCIYDVAADCADNFYILKISQPQKLMKFNAAGLLLNSFQVTGAPAVGFGSSLCIVGNDIYYSDTLSRHGIITGNTLVVGTINNYFQNPYFSNASDMAACPGIPVYSPVLNATICADQLPYTWNGNTYNASGIYNISFSLLNGCDSIATLNLAVNPVLVAVVDSVTICSQQLPFTWHNQNYASAGNYQLNYTGSNGCDSMVKLHLTVHANPLPPAVVSPVKLCRADTGSVALQAFSTGTLFWYSSLSGGTGTTITPEPPVNQPGVSNYYVSQQINGCEGPRATIVVSVYGIEQLPVKDIIVCQGTAVNLNSLYNTTGFSISWTFNDMNIPNPASVNGAGNYQLVVSDNFGCTDTAMVKLINSQQVIADAGEDINASYGSPVLLSGNGGSGYEWSPAGLLNNSHLQNPTAILKESTTFYLTVTSDAGCEAMDSVQIKLFTGQGPVIPAAFSPNGDNRNDIFKAIVLKPDDFSYLRVYNRYGLLLFESRNSSIGWDGTYKAIRQDQGTYIWTLQLTLKNGKAIQKHGSVILIR